LEVLKDRATTGEIDLIYFDESGFTLTPNLPYGWSQISKTISIPSKRSKKLNVMGFLNIKKSKLFALTSYDKVDSDMVVLAFNEFAMTISGATTVVIDNASVHTSETFKEMIPIWKNMGLHIFFLPPYSPHLNPIEILWKFMKYHWIDFNAYKSTKHMSDYIDNIIINYGTKYEIQFE